MIKDKAGVVFGSVSDGKSFPGLFEIVMVAVLVMKILINPTVNDAIQFLLLSVELEVNIIYNLSTFIECEARKVLCIVFSNEPPTDMRKKMNADLSRGKHQYS